MAAIDIQRSGATAILTMNRPEQRNALDHPMREAFAAAVAEVRDDAAVRAVVLTGAGGHFCAGGDVNVLAEQQNQKRDIFEGRERIRKIHRWFDELVELEKPVIAAVDGVAFGAGLSLALGIFDTPLLAKLPENVRAALGASVPHPARLGLPDEFAMTALHVLENPMLNGETIRLDGAIRMTPR